MCSQLRALDQDEVEAGVGRGRLGEQRLAGPRGSVEEEAAGQPDTGLTEHLGILEQETLAVVVRGGRLKYSPIVLGKGTKGIYKRGQNAS